MSRLEQRIEKLESTEQNDNQNFVVLFAPTEGASQEERAAHRQKVEQAKEDGQQVIGVKFVQTAGHENT